MSIKIHHGPPGSYKTSGAVMDDFIPAIKAGRKVVTNVRGLTVDKALEVFPDAPDSFDIIHVDSSTKEGRDQLARWFHWVPLGCLMLLDEAQSIFPKRWRDKDIKELDYPEGIDAATEAGRPHNWETAWEMHRHYNWDVVLTTPSIKLIRSDIRECAEMAYRHKNQAVIGIKGKYLEALHPADSNGGRSDFVGTPVTKRIKKHVWKLYDSTATGQHADTIAGRAFWKDPKLLLALGVAAGAFTYSTSALLASSERDSALGRIMASDSETAVEGSPPAAITPDMVPPSNPPAARRVSLPRMDSRQLLPVGAVEMPPEPFGEGEIFMAGFLKSEATDEKNLLFKVANHGTTFIETSTDLKELGYQVEMISECMAKLTWYGQPRWVKCGNAAPPTQRRTLAVTEPNPLESSPLRTLSR